MTASITGSGTRNHSLGLTGAPSGVVVYHPQSAGWAAMITNKQLAHFGDDQLLPIMDWRRGPSAVRGRS